ncbi:hypothetical protein [Nocardioides sp. Root140]|uniref:hypothetical protein n=1 Tax=Nocardioides sp. Root140 TaxID=1736460 RepID=UPI0012E390EB|nr:hypothetical protein [Nocardioides sp. Root140]
MFAPAARQVAVPAVLPKFGKLVATAEKQELSGVSPVDRAARKAGKQRAHAQAEAWARDLMNLANATFASEQAAFDASWSDLLNNDPSAVLRALREALSVSAAPAHAVTATGGIAGLVVFAPSPQELPSEKPSFTARGTATASKINKTDLAVLTNKAIAARMILVARQCFAAAPNLAGCRVVVVDSEKRSPRLAATIDRMIFERNSGGAEPFAAMRASSVEVITKPSGRTGELGALKLDPDSEYAEILEKGV